MKRTCPCAVPPTRNPGERRRCPRRSGGRDALFSALVVIFCLLILSGCAKRPGPSVRLQAADLSDPEATYRRILTWSERIRTLQGTAHLRVKTEGRKASLDAVIACDRDGRLRIEILDWLNHVLFLAIFRQKGFLTYSPSENDYREGPDDTEKIRELLGIPLKGRELTALAMGDPFFLPVSEPTVRLSVDQDVLLLDVEASGTGPRYLVWLDEEERPERMFVLRPYGGGTALGDLQVDYGRYRRIDSVWFPHRIRLTATGLQRVLQIDYQRIVLNETLEADLFRFEPPVHDRTE